MGYELELRVSPGLSSLADHLAPLLRGPESIKASGLANPDGKQYCSIGAGESDAPGWPHCCEFVLEDPGRVYVLAHLRAHLDIAERLAAHLQANGYCVEVFEP